MELLRDAEPGPTGGGTVGSVGEEAPRPRMSPATIAAKVSGQLPSQAQQVVFRAPSIHLDGAI